MIHIETVHFHVNRQPAIASALLAAMFAGGEQEPDSGTPATAATGPLAPPKLGEYWQGQGGVYVGVARGVEGSPDSHVVLATDPRSMFEDRMLGTYGVDVTGATSDHDGLANTIALAAAGSELCEEIRALVIDGHGDFGLMSRQDARLCMANVPEQFEKEWHLTSTQSSSNYAWIQYFLYGHQDSNGKKFEARARLVRRFVL